MKKSKNTVILGLLQKPEFKSWVLSPTEESDYYWKRWMSKYPDHKEDLFKAREVILRLRFKSKVLSDVEVEGLLDQIIKKPVHKKSHSNLGSEILKYAAILLLMTSIGLVIKNFYFTNQYAETQAVNGIVRSNPKGQKSIIHLPDGTKVHLNSGSVLQYFSDYQSNRYVELEGEAFFEVEKKPENPFVVKSGGITTTALGTTFNVNIDDSGVKVLLIEGKVRVETVEKTGGKILNPMEEVTYDFGTGLSEVIPANNMDDVLWVQGIIKFENTPLEEVVEVLEDWYGVEIVIVGEPMDFRYSGQFNNEYLSNVLQTMSYSLGMEYRIEDKYVELKKNDAMKK